MFVHCMSSFTVEYLVNYLGLTRSQAIKDAWSILTFF